MFPMDRRPLPVTVEYDSRGQRVRKTFPNEYAARRFYIAKDKAGLHPAIAQAKKEKEAQS
jgi:hypothetical protein